MSNLNKIIKDNKIVYFVVIISVIFAILIISNILLSPHKDYEAIYIGMDETNGEIIFTLNTNEEINVPRSGRWDQYYPEIYKKNDGGWEKLGLTLECFAPKCEDPCDAPIIACEALNRPPICKNVSAKYDYIWDRKYRVSRERDCDGEEQICYENTLAEPGKYKVMFYYKLDSCPSSKYDDELKVFENNIETIEKTFSIEEGYVYQPACETGWDCWDNEEFECSLEDINLDSYNREISPETAKERGFNSVLQRCYNNTCYCMGKHLTTH